MGRGPDAHEPTKTGRAMKPTAIVLHHSLTTDGQTVSWNAIRAYHTSWRCEGYVVKPESVPALIAEAAPVERPWRDIGYHFGIELVGSRYEILTGRMMTETGAHCSAYGMNAKSIGICFIGSFDIEPVPVAQMALGIGLVRTLMQVFRIGPSHVYGHRELAPYKSCPGRRFNLDQFRTDLAYTPYED